MQLKPHQKEIVDLNPSRALIPDGTGTGKTIIGIALADKNCNTCLVVTLKDNVKKWEREIKEFSSKPSIYTVMSKENFKKNVHTLPYFDGVIGDECHTLAGMKSQLSKLFRYYLKKHDTPYRWLMSATPITANWLSVFVLANHLGADLNYYRFMRTFFHEVHMGGRKVWKENKRKEEQLIEYVRRLARGRMIRMHDIEDVPEQKMVTEYFELTPEQEKAIEELNNTEHIVRWTKTHTIENGCLVGNEYEPAKIFPSLKIDRIKELASQNNKIAIFARYNYQLVAIKKALLPLDREIFVINGETKDRDDVVQQIEKTEKCIALINTSCSAGYELPSIGVIVYASLSFSYLDYDQSMGRFLRINKLKPNIYYHLVVRGGVDEGVFDCIMNKKDFYVELFNKK